MNDTSVRGAWHDLFARLLEGFLSVSGSATSTTGKLLAERCMRRMHVLDTAASSALWGVETEEAVDTRDPYYRFWLYSPRRKDSIFDDALIMALIHINPEAAPYWDGMGESTGLEAGPSLPNITYARTKSDPSQNHCH